MNVVFWGFQDKTFPDSSDECPNSTTYCEKMTVSRGRVYRKVLFANLFCSWSSVAVYSYTVVQSALNKDISIRAERFQEWILLIDGTLLKVTLCKKKKKKHRHRKVTLHF